MQISHQSFQLPQYESALLKKQRQSRLLSPKVTHVYPEIKQIEKIKLKKHHLDDTEMKLVLQYDYQENHLPKQYSFNGTRLDYDKNQYNERRKGRKISNVLAQTRQGNLKLNTEYFETQNNLNKFTKPQKDITHDPNSPQRQFEKHYQTQQNQPGQRLKKSISVTDFESLRRDQNQMQQKVISKLNQIQTQTDRLNKNIQHIKNSKQKSAYNNDPLITRYKSQKKRSSAEKNFTKLKEKLERERTKEKHRLEAELQKIKQETRKIKQEEKKRKKSFKEIMEKQQPNNKYIENLILSSANGNRIPGVSLRTVMTDMNHVTEQLIERGQHDILIGEKFSELQKKYLPKTNIVNKRIQCEIYDPRNDHLRRLQEKPRFMWNDESDTDSQFSDF